MISAAKIIQAGASAREAALFYGPLMLAADRFDIDTELRVAAFLAQLSHESSRFTRVVENLNYSADRLAKVWPSRFADMTGQPTATAKRIARRPEDIANVTYAGRMGNGSAGSGDGWKYRGRGLIQITGREMYQLCGEGLELDLIAKPDTLEVPLYAALSAGWYWHHKRLNAFADKGDIRGMTRVINGGLHGLTDRQATFDRLAGRG